jgi:CelD/BcsL family acetyltransferase involved in cellulose biosynthesis
MLEIERSAGTDLRAEWAALADQVSAAPFLHPGWITAWFDAFGSGRVRLLVVRRDGELVAAMPMEERRRGLRAPVNSHSPLFGPLAVDVDARDELLRKLFEDPGAGVELDFLDGDEQTLEPIAGAGREARMLLLRRTAAWSRYIVLRDDFAAYQRRLSRNRRRGLRRQQRRLEGSGKLEFEVHDGADHLDALLEEVFAVESSGWKGDRGTAIASASDTRRFYSDVARWAAERDWLRLAFLRLDGEPIACDFALEHDGCWYTLKAGYDERLRSFGPGALLLRFEIEHCYARGIERLELLGHDDSFKASWTDDRAERVWLRGFRRTPSGVAAWAAVAARERARALAARTRGSAHAFEAGLALQMAAGLA